MTHKGSVVPAITATAAAAAATAAVAYFVAKPDAPNTEMIPAPVGGASSICPKCANDVSSIDNISDEKPKKTKERLQYELYEIDYSMHQEHRKKLLVRFDQLPEDKKRMNAAIVLSGGNELSNYDTDTDHAFRQESFFQYLFGVREPGCTGAIDLERHQSILFVPRLSDEWELWCGKRKSLEYFQKHYLVDAVHYVDEMCQILQQRGITYLFRLFGKNTDSGLETQTICEFDGYDKFSLNDTVLHPELVECRLIKTEKELDILRYCNRISSNAHIDVMKSIQPGMMEYHAESTFLHSCYSKGGARLHAYTCICGSGNNAATLHYGHAGAPNDKLLNDGDIFLNDMGAEFHCYASDITCTFPVNGVFSSDQKIIYEGVLKSHDAVMKAMKPGVEWTDMHILSHRVLTEHLLEWGLFQNGTVDELMEHEISAYFYPHGLGHLMGLDVHDVGGWIENMKRPKNRLLRKLRSGRTLQENMVLTVEPGCYFIDAQLNECLSNPTTAAFINQEMLKRFRGTGGVRIESDVIVTSNGIENMTRVPRTVEEIETVMNN